jgi:hypothetical protein
MNANSESDATVDNQYEIVCPQCKAPVMSVDGSAVAGVLLDDVECDCAFRGVIGWTSPVRTDTFPLRLS